MPVRSFGRLISTFTSFPTITEWEVAFIFAFILFTVKIDEFNTSPCNFVAFIMYFNVYVPCGIMSMLNVAVPFFVLAVYFLLLRFKVIVSLSAGRLSNKTFTLIVVVP
ncbi:hypothetical protein MBORA_01160 [Methanobrevibacter oralis]|uniref:Uncharacterized protein n=1 Tax=Methanobrevibacter oralis TaxID=66851 RepID=A0A166C5R0_METOA|nr:hypothetical protein MBORA_01160 [Methanobrevibacter oralis]